MGCGYNSQMECLVFVQSIDDHFRVPTKYIIKVQFVKK